MFVLHTDKDGNRNVGVIVSSSCTLPTAATETKVKYQLWFGGTINRKPRVFWVDKTECKKISPKSISVGN